MADTTALKNRIRAAIKANDNQEITGPVLQQALLDMVDELNGATETEASQRQSGDNTLQQNITAEKNRAEGAENALQQNITAEKNRAEGAENALQQNITAEKNRAEGAENALQDLIDGIVENIENGYMYAGIATPSSTPVTKKVFYLALTAGTYTNFDSIEVSQGINILKYNGSTWSLDAFIGIDDILTSNSQKLVKSIGIVNEIFTTYTLGQELMVLNGLLHKDGTREFIDNFFTSTPQPINKDIHRIIEFNNVFFDPNASSQRCGFILCDSSDNVLYYNTSTTGSINLDDYPAAAYFRYSHARSHADISVVVKIRNKELSDEKLNKSEIIDYEDNRIVGVNGQVVELEGYVVVTTLFTLGLNSNGFSWKGGAYYLAVYNSTDQSLITITPNTDATTQWIGSTFTPGTTYIIKATFNKSAELRALVSGTNIYKVLLPKELLTKFPRIDISQSLSNDEKMTARKNIGLGDGSYNDVLDLNSLDGLVSGKAVANSIYKKVTFDKDNLVNTGLLHKDGTHEWLTDFGYSNKIDISNIQMNTIVYNAFYDPWPQSERCGFILCDASDTVLFYNNAVSGVINLTDYPTASYFRFSGAKNNNDIKVEYYVSKKAEDDFSTFTKLTGEDLEVGYYYDNNGIIAHDTNNNQYSKKISIENVDKIKLYTKATSQELDIYNYYITDGAGNILYKTLLKTAYSNTIKMSVVGAKFIYINCASDFLTTFFMDIYPLGVYDVVDYLGGDMDLLANQWAISRSIGDSIRIVDNTTGKKYRIAIENGQIIHKEVKIDKVLVLGNSFTALAASTSFGGGWRPTEQRGCQASVPNNDFCGLLKNGLGASVLNRWNTADFEQNHNCVITDVDGEQVFFDKNGTRYKYINGILNVKSGNDWIPSDYEGGIYNYDFAHANGWKDVHNLYDAVVLCFGENNRSGINLQTDIEKAIQYLQERAEDATIYVSNQWSPWQTQMQAAATAKGVTFISVDSSKSYRQNNTYMLMNGEYTSANIGGHPDDYGFYLIASRLHNGMVGTTLPVLPTASIVSSTGGTISIPHLSLVPNEVVTVFVTPDSGKALSTLQVVDANGKSIKATKRTDSSYTFIAPYINVTITPTWVDK